MFLVADRQMNDHRFMETVVLLLSVDRSGATGLIINKPSDTSLSALFPGMRKTVRRKDRLYSGGPVEVKQLLMLLRSKKRKKYHARDQWRLPRDRPRRIAGCAETETGRRRVSSHAGYAGWTAGQLEWEIRRGDWHLVVADASTVFHDDESKVWPALLRKSEEIMVRERNLDAPLEFLYAMASPEKLPGRVP
jgi:putative transcriptional regulator